MLFAEHEGDIFVGMIGGDRRRQSPMPYGRREKPKRAQREGEEEEEEERETRECVTQREKKTGWHANLYVVEVREKSERKAFVSGEFVAGFDWLIW